MKIFRQGLSKAAAFQRVPVVAYQQRYFNADAVAAVNEEPQGEIDAETRRKELGIDTEFSK
jgi:hypothetical protein